jgi:hypothetical protein
MRNILSNSWFTVVGIWSSPWFRSVKNYADVVYITRFELWVISYSLRHGELLWFFFLINTSEEMYLSLLCVHLIWCQADFRRWQTFSPKHMAVIGWEVLKEENLASCEIWRMCACSVANRRQLTGNVFETIFIRFPTDHWMACGVGLSRNWPPTVTHVSPISVTYVCTHVPSESVGLVAHTLIVRRRVTHWILFTINGGVMKSDSYVHPKRAQQRYPIKLSFDWI